ncbi:MAG: hypothetical protein ACRDRU_22990 [Pseudonocardiaceae bacterium]
MSPVLGIGCQSTTVVPVQADVPELLAVVVSTLPGAGLDRMTGGRLEEFMTPVALTAHL